MSNKRLGVRVKFGAIWDPKLKKWQTIISVWDNLDCIGHPHDFVSGEFDTEGEASMHCRETVLPEIMQLLNEAAKKGNHKIVHKEIDEMVIKVT